MKKIRVGLNFIDPRMWTGGYNYLINLIRVLLHYESNRIQPVLFVGTDVSDDELHPFFQLQGLTIIRTSVFDLDKRKNRLLKAVLTGIDSSAAHVFDNESIDVVFENATFYGWRFNAATIAWIPDFQHRMLPKLFGRKQGIKREIGFRMQLYTGRTLMLSSQSARSDFEQLYSVRPKNITVAPFAIEVVNNTNLVDGITLRDKYTLPECFFYLPNQYYRHKNHHVVIEAVRILRNQGINAVVASSGNPDDLRGKSYYQELRQSVADQKLNNNFRFLGLIPYNDVKSLMGESIAVINPSRFEGWSTTVEESKAMNIPLVLSNIDVHCEQAPSAYFFEPTSAKKLAEVLSNLLSQPDTVGKLSDGYGTQSSDYHLDVERYAHTLAEMFIQSV